MEELVLVKPSSAYAEQIEDYRKEFPSGGTEMTPFPDRIPGMDRLEEFSSVAEWLRFCDSEEGRISWYMSVRPVDGRIVGFCCLRHKLEYDDDDPAAAFLPAPFTEKNPE